MKVRLVSHITHHKCKWIATRERNTKNNKQNGKIVAFMASNHFILEWIDDWGKNVFQIHLYHLFSASIQQHTAANPLIEFFWCILPFLTYVVCVVVFKQKNLFKTELQKSFRKILSELRKFCEKWNTITVLVNSRVQFVSAVSVFGKFIY